MGSGAAEDGLPCGASLARCLALEHFNLAHNVSLQDVKELLPDVPRDSLLYVAIAKNALEAAAGGSEEALVEVNDYASTLKAIKRRIEGDGSPGSTAEKLGEQELEELRMWAESRRQRSALQEFHDLFLKKKVQKADALPLGNQQTAVDKGKRPQAEDIVQEEEVARAPAGDGPEARAGPSGEAALPSSRHVRKRKVVEYEEEPEPTPAKRSTRRADGAAGSDAGERQASPSPARQREVASRAGKKSPGAAARPARQPKEPAHDLRKPHSEPKAAAPEPKKPAAGQPTAPKEVRTAAPEGTERQTRGSKSQRTGGKAGWGSLHLEDDSGLEPKKHQQPPPMTFLSPNAGAGPSGAGPSATQCFTCKGGLLLGYLIPCMGGCGKHFHVSCPGLSQPSLIEVMSQRCEQCLESLEEAAKAARSSTKKTGPSAPTQAATLRPASRGGTGRTAVASGQVGRQEEHEDGGVHEQGGPEVHDEVDEIEDSEEPNGDTDQRDEDYRDSVPIRMRKRRKGYSNAEDAKLLEGMRKYQDHPNKWRLIQRFGRSVFHDRDPVSLKDRWRNLQKYM